MPKREGCELTQKLRDEIRPFQQGFELEGHVGISDLQRKSDWRGRLDELKMMLILDRTEPFAVMVKPSLFQSLRTYIAALEDKVDELETDLLFSRRQDEQWKSGDDLQQAVTDTFRTNEDTIRRLVHGESRQ